MKLTLKSLRSDSSAVDLETLVNMLTSSAAGSHSRGQVAVMYISLDAVDSNSQDAIHVSCHLWNFMRPNRYINIRFSVQNCCCLDTHGYYMK